LPFGIDGNDIPNRLNNEDEGEDDPQNVHEEEVEPEIVGFRS